jgi:amidase
MTVQMSAAAQFPSAFVPHDLSEPIAGNAGGPLSGLSVAVKDMYDIAGYRTGGGSPDWLQAQAPAVVNAGAVQKLLDAGATLIGKTVCDEFFFSVTGANAHYGTPVNPHAPGRLPGGSSSGSAAATAAGVCDIGLGSDTGGSVRIPAAFCGVFGIRPTHGRMDLSGAMAMASSFDVGGWFARDAEIFRRVGQVLLDYAGAEAPLRRLVMLEDAFEQADPELSAVLRAKLEALAGNLPPTTPARIAPNGLDLWRESFRLIQAWEVWKVYGEFIAEKRPQLGPGIRERMEFAAGVSDQDVAAARRMRGDARAAIEQTTPPGTILALPTAPCIAPPVDASAEALESMRESAMRLICIAGLAGLPQVTIPAGSISGCPVGLSFIGWRGGDEVLLELAGKLATV